MKQDAMREAVLKSMTQQTVNNWHLAQLLHDIYYEEVWENWGFETWEDYVEVEVGMHISRAGNFVRVYHHALFEWELDPKNLPNLSWTRLSIMARSKKVTAKNFESWAEKAKGMSCCALEAKLIESTKVSFSISVTPEQASALSAVLDGMKKDSGFASRGDALEVIIRDWGKAHPTSKRRSKVSKITKAA